MGAEPSRKKRAIRDPAASLGHSPEGAGEPVELTEAVEPAVAGAAGAPYDLVPHDVASAVRCVTQL